ncbi:MAG TPA: hypothetical protein VOA80_05115 [Thermoanaerobaculia bacterium]|nr:hypothetical protein [Thermoanaerobaculia bacterium]
MSEPGELGPSIPGGKAAARLRQIRSELGIQVPGLPAPAWSQFAVSEERARLAALQPAGAVQPAWQFLGPSLILTSEDDDHVPAVGRISAVAIDPGSPDHILVGAAAGGIWETSDGGRTWAPRGDDQRTLTIGAVVFDPGDPLTVFAGTGEGNAFSVEGTGLLRSANGGTTWQEVPDPDRTFDGQGFYALLVVAPDTLVAATTAGLYRSTDGGKSWAQIFTAVTWDLSLGSGSAAGELLAAGQDGLRRSRDSGLSWEQLPVDLPGVAAADLLRLAVSHAPADGGVVYVFAAATEEARRLSRYEGPFLWRREVAGEAFTPITPPLGMFTGQGEYDWLVKVAPPAPSSQETVFLGARALVKGIRLDSGAYRWTNVASRDGVARIHPDQHVLAFGTSAPVSLYAGNDGGLYRSDDGGESWQSLNAGLGITEIEYLAQHPQLPDWLLAGTQDNGTVRYQGSPIWTQVAGGDGGECAVDEVLPQMAFHSFDGMGIQRSTHGADPETWSAVGPPVSGDYQSLFYPPLELHGSVLVQAGSSVWVSTDAGDTWTEVLLDDGAGVVSALAIPSADSILAGTISGDLFRLERRGGVWRLASARVQPRAGFISSILADPRDEDRLWVTYADAPTPQAGQIFHSDDGGSTWIDMSVSETVPIPTHVVEIDPTEPDTIYAGTEMGVFRHRDGEWATFGEGLPNVIVGDLVFHLPTRLLRAGTRSRGVWEIAVPVPAVEG